MSANNSISQLLEQFLELNTNSLETFNRINEAISTDKETVVIDLYDPSNDNVKSVQIPAFGYLKREIERLNTNLESIMDVEGTGSTVRLKDGTFRKLYTSKLKGPSKSITKLAAPTEFNTKLNEFFEDFLNPLLTIKLDISGQIPVETERIYLERFIFDSKDAPTLDQFEELYKGKNELVYSNIKSDIAQSGLKYYIDSEVIEMPIRTVQYSGKFDVVKITNEQKSIAIDGTTETKTIKLFALNKLSYHDSSKDMMDTEVLKVGDSLAVNSGELKTRYLIKAIDNSTSQVELELVEGFESIKIGADALTIYRDIDTDLDVEINIGFDERQIVFIKPIDPSSNIPSDEYSPGIGFYSNELQIDGADGNKQTLASYYKDEVADFGQFIKALSIDYIPPAAIGITPTSPVLNAEDLKVVQINKHLTDNTTTQKIKQLKSDKISSDQNLKNLDDAIKVKKTLLNTKKFKSTVERDKQKNELASLISKRESESKLYSSIVNEIKSSADSADLASVSPKFRVRGFWPIPEPRRVGEEISQEVVQFKTRYRYVSTSGKTSQVEQIEFNDTTNQTSKSAAFSNWVEVDGPVRKREKDENGKYRWITESEEDSQAVNFNSIDIPISSGEIVEIMVKSVSEAGYPANPLTSEWSELVKIEFPEGELSTDSLSGLVSSNELDNVKVSLNNDLEAAGVYSHVAEGFTVGDVTYAHTATGLASGFLTPEQSPISLYDKLLELQNEINSLKAQINKTVGELSITIIDEEGNVTPITNNETVKLFAGYYINELPETEYKGYIVTKNFKINLSNSEASDLELISRIIGDVTKPTYVSTASETIGLGQGQADPTIALNDYYVNQARYDLVPVVYQNLSDSETTNKWFNEGPEQSTQLRGQYVYSRFKNISNDDTLYVESGDPTKSGSNEFESGLATGYDITDVDDNINGCYDFTNASITTYDNTSNPTVDFIWNGAAGNSSGTTSLSKVSAANREYDESILLHINHPLTSLGEDALYLQASSLVGIPKAASLRANQANGKKQAPFKVLDDIVNDNNYNARKTIKTSFEPNDQYLLGGKSVGSFLYLAPLSTESHVVNANNISGKRVIKGNNSAAINLDLVFQYRMTDYHGTGSTGTGKIGGTVNQVFTNLTYSKKIGIDILDVNGNDFKFDVEVYAKYKPTGKNINAISSSMLASFDGISVDDTVTGIG